MDDASKLGLVRHLQLVLRLGATAEGLTIDETAAETEVSRRTAQRLRAVGPIGRFVRRISLRRNNRGTLAVSRHPTHFLVALMCKGRAGIAKLIFHLMV